MSFLGNIITFLTTDIRTTLFTLIIGFVVYKIAKFYVRVYSLPPGPLPLPLLGNILYFRGTKNDWFSELSKVPKKYGPVFTFWLGPKPFIFITDLEIAREAFRKNDFAGRPESFFGELISNKEHKDIVFTDYGHTWEALRRVAHSAAQKYSTTDKLVYLACDRVEQTIDLIVAKEGLNKPINPFNYIYYMFLNILATSAVGKSFHEDDPEYKQLKYAMSDFAREAGPRFMLWEFSSIIRFIDRKLVAKQRKLISNTVEFIKREFESHYRDYDESVIRDFCDALLSAKNDALKEGKESAPYLTDINLAMTVFDLFLAGTDTSQLTFKWILLLMTYNKEVMNKLKEEIESEIGDRIPTHEDRNKCHYVMAFISETLRFKNVVPTGLFHSAVVDSKIGEYSIPQGMGIFAMQGCILNDDKYWSNPDQFKPERFLENGKYITTRPSAFIPFGMGRRVCLGEKLAIADLFLVLVRFIQKTSEYNVELYSHNGLDPDPEVTDAFAPKEYKVIFKSIP